MTHDGDQVTGDVGAAVTVPAEAGVTAAADVDVRDPVPGRDQGRGDEAVGVPAVARCRAQAPRGAPHRSRRRRWCCRRWSGARSRCPPRVANCVNHRLMTLAASKHLPGHRLVPAPEGGAVALAAGQPSGAQSLVPATGNPPTFRDQSCGVIAIWVVGMGCSRSSRSRRGGHRAVGSGGQAVPRVRPAPGPLLLSPSLDDWLPQDHLARFVADLVDGTWTWGRSWPTTPRSAATRPTTPG